MKGDFPVEMQELFQGEDGLFPSPHEISFNCSCPDWALMCKHVAVALYGVGVRLDEQPLLFFELRGIDWDDLSMSRWRIKSKPCSQTRINPAAGLWMMWIRRRYLGCKNNFEI